MKSLECWILLLAISVLAISGCGGEAGPTMVPVTGTVTMGGSPVEGASVAFLAGGASHAASGTTDAEGKFSLKTLDKEGAVLGDHTVTISKHESAEGGEVSTEDYLAQATEGAAPAGPKNLLPKKYGDPGNSGLTATVEEGAANDFTFELQE